MRINRYTIAVPATLALALAVGTAPAWARTTADGATHGPGPAAEIAPYSPHPSETRPFAVCPPPTAMRATCMSAIVPTEGGEPVTGPALEGSGQLGGFSPSDLRSAYGLTADGGAGMTIAITVAYDNPNAEADLATYRSHYGLPPCTTANGCFAKLNQDGEQGPYPDADESWALESSLDLDMASAACPQCHILLVEAESNQLEDLGLAIERASIIGADVISNSWGAEEFSEEDTIDDLFSYGSVPSLFATGDDGYGVSYPAASPDVVAVGGTSLSRSGNPRGWSEEAWAGGGSGCSFVEPKPEWQLDPGCPNRAVADVSAVADPQTPVSVYDTFESSGWELVGGTSAATPLLAGVEAVSTADFRAAGPSGFARTGNGGGLFDVTEGENGSCASESQIGFDASYLCQAEAGYDGPTGWGTPDGPQSLPVALTEEAVAGSTAGAVLHGSIDPRGLPTDYRFEYGTSTAYGSSVPVPAASAGSASGYARVSQTVGGLQGQTLYHYRIVATNSAGTHLGVDRTFGTTPPAVRTGPPKDVHAFDATLRAEVNPEGLQTAYHFEYGLSTDYGYKAPARSAAVGAGLADVAVSTYVSGLRAGKIYHYRVVAENSAGTTYGTDRFLVTDPARWTAESLPQPPESGNGHEAFGVSCLQPDDCVAVGGNWSLEVHTGVTLAERWDGSEWTVMDTPNPPGLDDGWEYNRSALLRGVSCPSASSCLAVGHFRDSSETTQPLAERWDGSAWTLLYPPVPPGSTDASFEGVSCAAADDCLAVGNWEDASEQVRALSEHWDGSDWTALAMPSPAGTTEHRLLGVSCPAAGACTAVGVSVAGGTERTLAERWNGTAWSIQQTVDPSGNQAWNSLAGVSCTGAGACTAVGTHYEKVGTDFVPGALVERWDGAAWSVQSVPHPPLSQGTILNGVSCATAGSCTAVGSYFAASGDNTYSEVLGVRWNGTAWSLLDMIGLADPIGWWHERWLHAVSCAEPEGCDAVGRGLAAPEGGLSSYQALGEHEDTPPYAGFTSSPETPGKGTPVAFDSSTTADPGHTIESYEWDFGDGEHSTGPSPSHTYEHAGDYAATLKVTDDIGRSGEVSHLVTVSGSPPLPAFTSSPASPTATEQVDFDGSLSDDDGSIVSYEWDFGDGVEGEGEAASHTFARAGNYQVTLELTDDEGLTAKVTHFVTVADAPPLAAFAVVTAEPTATLPTGFDGTASSDPDGTVEGYAWDFGDGTAQGTGPTPSHTYAHPGEYLVTLEVSDDEGATAKVTHPVTVAGVGPQAVLKVLTQTPTATRPVAFDGSDSNDPDGTVAGYAWSFGEGAPNHSAAPIHSFSHAGEYPVTLTVVDDEGKTAQTTRLVSVAPAPLGSLDIRHLAAARRGRIVLVLDAPDAGRLAATATASHAGRQRRAARRRFSYGTGSAFVARAGDARLTIRPRDGALRALRRSGRLRVAISVTFEAPGGTRTARRTLVVGSSPHERRPRLDSNQRPSA